MRDAHSGRGEPGPLCSPAVSSLSTEELCLELIDEYIKEKEAEYPPNQMIAETLKLVPRSTNPELLSSCRALEVSPINDTKPLEMPLSSCSQAEPRPSERMQSVTLGVHMVPPPCDRSLESWCIKPAPQSLSPCSYSSLSCNALSANDALEALLLPKPELKITEQPKQRGMRFRYECEGRSAGSILGENSTDQSKIMPAIEVLNCDNLKEVKLMACLVWKDSPYRVHPHSLVGKDCHDGICEVTIKPKLKRTHSFHNLGIQCVRKKEIEDAVEKKLKLGIDPFNAGHWKNHEEVDMNVVRLCFQAYFQDSSGNTQTLGPILSEPIYDKKSTNTSELKICRMNKETGQCVGGEEVYLLCDKVQKEDIAVVFKRDCWEAQADFSQADVHRQIAIVFKTPPYQDLEIGEPVTVNVYLQRLTDSVCSESCAFTYLPKDHDTYGVDQKRKLGFPDVMGELSCPDPHGIEAKRRMKKPTYKDHLFSDLSAGAIMPFSQLCSMEQPSTSEFFSRTGNALSQAKDSFLDYDCFSKSQSHTSYMDTHATEVSLSAVNGAQDEDLQQEFFWDPLYGYVGSIPENLLSSDTTNSSNIAHLVGNSLRASECQEDVASYHMKEI